MSLASCLTLVRPASRSLRYSSSSSTIKALQDAFRDPSSPFHLAPGATGPSSPDDTPSGVVADPTLLRDDVNGADVAAAREAREKLTEMGYDPTSFWEQPIVWGDHDSFQHVNNVRYVRFFESGRMKWLTSVADELGGPDRVRAMLQGRGISFILKSISVNFKRPVVFPDTLLIAHKPHLPPGSLESKPKSHFNVAAVAYSYAQQAVVAESDSVVVWYDYDALRKCDPGEESRQVIWRRMRSSAE